MIFTPAACSNLMQLLDQKLQLLGSYIFWRRLGSGIDVAAQLDETEAWVQLKCWLLISIWWAVACPGWLRVLH